MILDLPGSAGNTYPLTRTRRKPSARTARSWLSRSRQNYIRARIESRCPTGEAVFVLFFLSGIAGLIYQVLWLRRLSVVFGVTGLASPWLLDAASSIYVGLHRTTPDSLELLTLARLVCSFAILVVPTAMMGMTLPLLSAAVASSTSVVGAGVSVLYAVNTAGAMIGTLLTGFVLIPAIGIQRAFLIAAILNVVVGAIALSMGRRPAEVADAGDPAASRVTRESPARLPRVLAMVVVVSGFASLGLEILWFRLMLQFVIATTGAFTAMLATVLAGIAIGGFLAARILKTQAQIASWLTSVLAGTGLATVASMSFLLWTIEHGWNTMGLWPAVLIALFLPSLLMGIGFPLALGLATTPALAGIGRSEIGRRVGVMYALIALAGLYLGSGLMLALSGPDRRSLIAVVAVFAAFVPIARSMPDPFKVAIDRRYGDLLPEFWRDESAQTAVSVRASQRQHVLYLDGLHQANDQPDMVTLHRAIGHLPMVLHGSPKDVLVVGLGGGATPGAVSQYPGARVQVVELSESVRRAAHFFAHVNYDLLNLPNVDVRIDDGRNFLALTDRRFDVITADIIQPGHAGAGHVYSREYFGLVRRALTDNGIVLQWIGHRPSVEYTLIMRTFLDVFPDATLWYDGNFMVGTRQPLTIHAGSIDRARQYPQTREALDAIGLTGFDVLRSWYTAGADEMRAFVGEGPLLTDDRPLVEYHHWLPAPQDQPPLDLSALKGDVNRIISGAAPGGR